MYDSKTKKDKYNIYKAEKGVVCQASEQAKDSVGRSDFLLFVQSQTHNNTKMSKLKLL